MKMIALNLVALLSLSVMLTAPQPATGQWWNDPEPQLDKPVEHIYYPPNRARDGKTVGVMFVPRGYGQGDAAERGLYELALQIPGVDYLFTGRTKDELFSQIKHLKDGGKKIDLLIIGGHMTATDDIFITVPDLVGIRVASGKGDVLGILGPDDVDIAKIQKEIQDKTANPKWKESLVLTKQVGDACKRLQLFKEMGEVMVPNAEVIVLSCYAGHHKAYDLMQNLGKVFLGKSGGSITGPTTEVVPGTVGVEELKEDAWFHWVRNEYRHAGGRFTQVWEGLKAGKWLSPGDAFASAGGWRKHSISAGSFPAAPACCTPSSSAKAFTLTATINEPRDDKYCKISTTTYVMKADSPGAPQAEFSLDGQAPKEVNPGDMLVLKVTGSVQNAKYRHGIVIRWYEDGHYMQTDDKLWIGMDFETNQAIPSGAAEFRIKVPATEAQELRLSVEFGTDYNAENRWNDWITFVYTRNP